MAGASGFISELLTDLSASHYAIAAAAVLGLIGALYVLCSALGFRISISVVDTENEESSEEQEGSTKGQRQKKQQQAKAKGAKVKPQRKITLPSHPLLAAEFKGHTGPVLSLDSDGNGKYMASCSEDRTIRLWFMKTLQEKEHKYTRKNVDLDHATHIKFSPDGTAVVTCLAGANSLHVFRLLKQKGGNVSVADAGVEFPQAGPHKIISIGIASTGKFVMTCTEYSFTVWTLKGDVLATVETHQSPNTCGGVSPCGKFIACAGFTPDVKLWEVGFSKTGEFQQVSRAMELKGHRASVLSLSFSGDSQRMATVSKDGTWKFWDIDVRYQLQEDPRLLQSAALPEQGISLIALAPDARVVAVAIGTSLFLYSSSSGELMQTLANMHGDAITSLCWEPSSLYLASAGGGDRHIRLWHNAPGLRETVRELKPKIPKASSEPLKRRLQEQVEKAEERLKSLGQL